ncbi:hypothetical protein SSX86_024849 [Deinandra increscens subsp. villosa]|uniref:Uncharacterized protein n=1 Tax=Deinandra increscens subsp. villosa TaxID=3103831 RepID=A0AAP0GNE5_9ASTR
MFDLNPRFRNTHGNYRHSRFNELETMDEDSGVCSPPLWQQSIISPPDSPVRFPNSRSLSPASRAQAIARGQREMMAMVESMPETSYELSLKDIVEQRREFSTTPAEDVVSLDETRSMEEGEARLILRGRGQESQNRRKKSSSIRRQESSSSSSNIRGRIVVRDGSMNHNNSKGLLINMFFPFSIGSKKKMKNSSNSIKKSSNHGVTVKSSPKRELLDKSAGGDRRDWWAKFRESEHNNSEGVGITSSSSGGSGESTGRSGSSGSSGSSTASSLRNNSDRRKNGCSYGCWSLFPFRKKKS